MKPCPTVVLDVILDLTPLHIVVDGMAHAAMFILTKEESERGNGQEIQTKK